MKHIKYWASLLTGVVILASLYGCTLPFTNDNSSDSSTEISYTAFDNKATDTEDIINFIIEAMSDAIVLINKALNTQLEVQDIEKYNSSFINKVFQNREADIVYKIKDRSIFILIEHQTKVDYLMPYRILEYEVAIMQSAIDLDKIKNKESKIPLVIPIVL